MKKILFLVIALFVISVVSALDMEVVQDSNVIVKDFGNSIEFTLKIANATPGTYNLFTLTEMSIEPREPFSITKSEIERRFTVSAPVNPDLDGYYTIGYTLHHRGVEKFDGTIVLKIVGLEEVITIESDTVNLDDTEVKIYVTNKENIYLNNLSARFSSIIFNEEETFDLKPRETKEISFKIDETKLRKTKAGVYIITTTFQTKFGTKKVDGNLYLGEKKGITSTEDSAGFLIRTHTLTKINSGNVIESVNIKIRKNIISRLFTSFNIEPTITDRKGFVVEYTWIENKLGPTEALIVKSKTNYVFPFLTILFATLALIGLKRFTETKLDVSKEVTPVKTKNGEFALKITLSMKAKKDVENVSIIDKVPAIVKIYKKFGTMKPDKIDTESRRIHWHLGDLNAGEVRVLSYIVYSKVGIVGKFSLPSALAVFEKEGQIHEVDSNKVFFMSDQIKG